MTDPSSNRDNRRAFGWILLPLAVFPLVALFTYDWRAMSVLQSPPAPSAN